MTLRPMAAGARPSAAGPGVAAWAPLLGGLLALFLVGVFVALDYRFDQAPHRLVKVLVGGVVMAWILIQPRFGLLLIPVVTPFLPWIPAVGIPGVNPLNILFGSVFLTWALYRVLHRRNVLRRGRLDGVFLVLVFVAALSIVRAAAFPTGYYFETRTAVLELFRSAVTLSVYFMVLSMARGERDRRWLAWSIVLGLLAEAVVTIAYGRNGSGGRALGSIGQSNELGAFLALYVVLALALLPAVRRLGGRLLLLAAVGTGVAAVVLTVSRGSVVAMAAGMAVVAVRSSRALTFALLALLATSPLWAPDYLKERMLSTQIEVEGTDEAALEGSAQLRVDTWRAIMQLVSDHPLDGVGFSGLEFVLPDTGTELGLAVKDSAHNTFLRFLGEMGIFGLFLFCLLIWKCAALAIEGARRARSRFDRQLSIGLLGATVSMAVSCAFGDRFFNVLITGSYWILLALVNDLVLERAADPPAEDAAPAARAAS